MSDSLKILAQSNPVATTETILYTVPDSTQDREAQNIFTSTTASTLCVCNRAGANTCRIAVVPSASATAPVPTVVNENWIVYDKSIQANDTFFMSIGITLEQGDQVVIYDTGGNLSFTLFGVETRQGQG
jgi:hypothetical protein